MYARGLSTRDIEDALTDATGTCLLSRSAVSAVTEALWEEYEAFATRDLSSYPVEYLFLDAIYETLRQQGGTQEALLCAWGILRDGRKVLESTAAPGVGAEREPRGLAGVLTEPSGPGSDDTGDDYLRWGAGAAAGDRRGLVAEPAATVLGHTIRNVLDKVPDSARAEVKAHVLSVCDALRWRRASKRPQTSWSGTGGCIPRQWPVSATIWRRG